MPLPDWSAFAAEYSGSLDGTVPDDQIKGDSIGLVPVGLAYRS
jgi:hypothetical protein